MREKLTSIQRKWVLIAAGGLVVLIALVYLALCVYVGASGTILSGVRAQGVRLGGMTREEAAQVMENWTVQQYHGRSYTLQCGRSSVQMDGSMVMLDARAVAQRAYMVGRSEPFLKRGAVILAHFMGGESVVDCDVVLSPEGEQALELALDQLGREQGAALVETVWSVDNDALVITKGVTGLSVDWEQAKERLLDALQQGGSGRVEIPLVKVQPRPLDVQGVHDQICAQAQDAYIEREGCVVVPHVVGVRFDVERVREQFDGLKEGQTMRAPLELTVPEMTQAKLQSMLFANVLGECTTDIGGTAYRLNNVEVAAKSMDGVILMPGDIFSYNDTLGARTTERGYLPAPAYIGGKTVDDVGGGICQNSSTLYLAALRANLEIVERTNHMYTVGYVPDGLDATVAYNAIDFKFRNNTDYPIRVEARVSGRKMIVKLHGTKTERFSVKMETQTLSTTPYKVTYKPDSSVAAGNTVVDTTAYTGKKIQTFRCVYDARGSLISRTLESTNNYRHRDKVILYNPADAEKLGLVDENGKVHTTVQPQRPKPVEPEPQPELPVNPEPEDPVPEDPVPGMPAVAPEQPKEEQPQPESPAEPPMEAPGAENESEPEQSPAEVAAPSVLDGGSAVIDLTNAVGDSGLDITTAAMEQAGG